MGGYGRCNSDGDNCLNSGRKVAAELPSDEPARAIISAGRGAAKFKYFRSRPKTSRDAREEREMEWRRGGVATSGKVIEENGGARRIEGEKGEEGEGGKGRREREREDGTNLEGDREK